MNFARETCEQFIPDAQRLFVEHYREVAHFQDIEFVPDYERYKKLEAAGILRIFTARDDTSKELTAYMLVFVQYNIRYSLSLQASQDILYVDKTKRGFGFKFIAWCEENLKDEGVQVLYQHTKVDPDLDFGPMLERKGYVLVDKVYAKRLDSK